MKLVVTILALLILTSCSISGFRENFISKNADEESSCIQQSDDNLSESDSEHSQQQAEAKFSKDDWRLILVNAENPLPKDFKVNLVRVQGYPVDERIKEPLENMINGAKNDGVDLLVCYGYRTYEQSKALFEKQVNFQLSKGLKYDDAVSEASRWVAPPGTSEHHTALALDIVTPSYQLLEHDFKNTAAAQWMKENAHKYGFILRYPEDKQDITGITFEPWHYRFVGKEAAEYIYKNNLCLEEFLKGENVR